MAHHADFDGEPATELPSDEPHTPNWVPVLGLCLLLAAAVYWVATGASAAPAPAAQAEPTARPAAAVPAATAPIARPGAPGAVAPASARPPMTPEQAEQLRKRVEEARKRREAQPAPAPAVAPR
jgi:hypothetical protein